MRSTFISLRELSMGGERKSAICHNSRGAIIFHIKNFIGAGLWSNQGNNGVTNKPNYRPSGTQTPGNPNYQPGNSQQGIGTGVWSNQGNNVIVNKPTYQPSGTQTPGKPNYQPGNNQQNGGGSAIQFPVNNGNNNNNRPSYLPPRPTQPTVTSPQNPWPTNGSTKPSYLPPPNTSSTTTTGQTTSSTQTTGHSTGSFSHGTTSSQTTFGHASSSTQHSGSVNTVGQTTTTIIVRPPGGYLPPPQPPVAKPPPRPLIPGNIQQPNPPTQGTTQPLPIPTQRPSTTVINGGAVRPDTGYGAPQAPAITTVTVTVPQPPPVPTGYTRPGTSNTPITFVTRPATTIRGTTRRPPPPPPLTQTTGLTFAPNREPRPTLRPPTGYGAPNGALITASTPSVNVNNNNNLPVVVDVYANEIGGEANAEPSSTGDGWLPMTMSKIMEMFSLPQKGSQNEVTTRAPQVVLVQDMDRKPSTVPDTLTTRIDAVPTPPPTTQLPPVTTTTTTTTVSTTTTEATTIAPATPRDEVTTTPLPVTTPPPEVKDDRPKAGRVDLEASIEDEDDEVPYSVNILEKPSSEEDVLPDYGGKSSESTSKVPLLEASDSGEDFSYEEEELGIDSQTSVRFGKTLWLVGANKKVFEPTDKKNNTNEPPRVLELPLLTIPDVPSTNNLQRGGKSLHLDTEDFPFRENQIINPELEKARNGKKPEKLSSTFSTDGKLLTEAPITPSLNAFVSIAQAEASTTHLPLQSSDYYQYEDSNAALDYSLLSDNTEYLDPFEEDFSHGEPSLYDVLDGIDDSDNWVWRDAGANNAIVEDTKDTKRDTTSTTSTNNGAFTPITESPIIWITRSGERVDPGENVITHDPESSPSLSQQVNFSQRTGKPLNHNLQSKILKEIQRLTTSKMGHMLKANRQGRASSKTPEWTTTTKGFSRSEKLRNRVIQRDKSVPRVVWFYPAHGRPFKSFLPNVQLSYFAK